MVGTFLPSKVKTHIYDGRVNNDIQDSFYRVRGEIKSVDACDYPVNQILFGNYFAWRYLSSHIL